jgi:hypothetical protein
MPTTRSLGSRLTLALVLAAGCDPPDADGLDEGPSSSTVDGTCEAAAVLEVTIDRSSLGDAPASGAVVVVWNADGEEVGRGETDFTLDALAPGSYTVAIERGELTADGTMAGEAHGSLAGTVFAVELAACETTPFDAVLSPLPSAGRLWVSSGESLNAFTAEQLAAGGDAEADARLEVALVNDFRGFAFDRLGNVWAAASPTYGARLLWFAPEQLVGRGHAEPRGELTATVFEGFAAISDVVVLADGSLWVAVRASDNSFNGFAIWDRAQLDRAVLAAAPVELEPTTTIAVPELGTRVDLELAPDGALWIADYDNDRLLRVDEPATWTGPSVDASFAVVLDQEGSAPQRGAENIGFDSEGNATAIFWTTGAVIPLAAEELAAAGDVELRVTVDNFWVDQLPTGLVVDGGDRLVMGNYASGGVGQLLGWSPGTMPEALLASTDIPDPADLVLDPRPR